MNIQLRAHSLAISLLALFLISPTIARAESAPATSSARLSPNKDSSPVAGLQIRPMFAYDFLSPQALNNYLGNTASRLGSNSDFKIEGGTSFGLALEYPVVEHFSLGARLEYFSGSSNMINVGQGTNSASLQASVSGIPLYATANVELPIAPQWSWGATAGPGIALSYKASLEVSNSAMADVPNGTLNYAGNPFTWIAGTHVSYQIHDHVGLRLDLAYRGISSDQLKLQESYGSERAGTLLRDQNNSNLNVDSSSFLVGAAVSVTL